MKNFVQEGKTLTVTAPSAITSGQYVIVGAIRGVAAHDAEGGARLELATEGVFTLPKVLADVIAAGDLLYWTGTACTKTAGTGSKPLVGVAVRAAGNGAATVNVKLGVHGITGPA
jgi:predicted RecA/RadA family phage recombinase